MFAFVIPLVSPEVAISWSRVCQLFERTIKSVCNQTSPEFRVFVVCNQIPEIEFNHQSINYVKVDFTLSDLTIQSKTLDRGYKVFEGLKAAKEIKPSHVMFVDADDCVSKYLVEFVAQNQYCDGWFVNKGYIFKNNSYLIYEKNSDFYDICGSCNIIKTELYDLENKGKEFMSYYYGEHRYILQELQKQNTNLLELPFRGVTYVVENGENYYNSNFNKAIGFFTYKSFIREIHKFKHFRPLTNSIRKEFGLYNTNKIF